ncbi:transcriptional regulator [Cellulomonas sp. NS3]|uniref:transcriptional regulator n=1 Tax=Cellulomonas sp. NS3 TaxID=2973977 RepID=UPI002162EEDC|nr:transcriptional regulator [Cellulomonas sp. NS3]
MTRASSDELLVLHAVRLRGFTDTAATARRFALDPGAVEELLLDLQALGHVAWSEFAGLGGWSPTDRGRAHGEQLLAAELAAVPGGHEAVAATYAAFLPLNDRLQSACTSWQLRPRPGDPLAENDHTDPAWDGMVVSELDELARALVALVHRLTGVLDRFGGYDRRFSAALDRVLAGDGSWVNRTGEDSCHTVWFELHEDLLATLGQSRGT